MKRSPFFHKTFCRDVAIRQVAIEVLLIFALWGLYGAWPVPDVNEQYYVGKAIHFWNPDWFPSDHFLDAPDSHWFYCATFGLLSSVFSPPVLVWVGRILVWGVAAFGWQRLSWGLIPRRRYSVLTAAGLLFFVEYFHLAGEWIAGGVEGKGFALGFVFLGLAAFVRGRYRRALFFAGVASAFHVLVGGWTVVAMILALLPTLLIERVRRIEPTIRVQEILPGLILGGAVALFGLIPALRLDAGVSHEVARAAHRIYVFERLPHHLVPSTLPWTFLLRFGLLSVLWFFWGRYHPTLEIATEEHEKNSEKRKNLGVETLGRWGRWNRFVGASLVIAGIGIGIDYGTLWGEHWGKLADRTLAAEILRFYLFRLSDWVVPAGIALGATAALASEIDRCRRNARTEENSIHRWVMQMAGSVVALGGLFFGAKFFLRRIANHLAAAATVDPAFPPLPKPTDTVAFLTAIVCLGVGGGVVLFFARRNRRSGVARSVVVPSIFAILALFAPMFGVVSMVQMKSDPLIPRSAPPKDSIAAGWLDVCRWVAANTPESAVFLTPRGCDSLKWNAHRADAGTWKEIPQDARSIVEWYKKMEDFYTPLGETSPQRWNQPLCSILINKGRNRFVKLAEQYHFDYVVAELPPYTIASYPNALARYNEFVEKGEVYRNAQFVVFRLR